MRARVEVRWGSLRGLMPILILKFPPVHKRRDIHLSDTEGQGQQCCVKRRHVARRDITTLWTFWMISCIENRLDGRHELYCQSYMKHRAGSRRKRPFSDSGEGQRPGGYKRWYRHGPARVHGILPSPFSHRLFQAEM